MNDVSHVMVWYVTVWKVVFAKLMVSHGTEINIQLATFCIHPSTVSQFNPYQLTFKFYIIWMCTLEHSETIWLSYITSFSMACKPSHSQSFHKRLLYCSKFAAIGSVMSLKTHWQIMSCSTCLVDARECIDKLVSASFDSFVIRLWLRLIWGCEASGQLLYLTEEFKPSLQIAISLAVAIFLFTVKKE